MVGELRDQAQEDLESSVQSEFGQSIQIKLPDGSKFKTFIGNTNLTSLMLDPETGLMVTGQNCFVTLILKEVLDFFGTLPKKQPPWQVEIYNISKALYFVKDVRPDDSQGLLFLTIGD